MLHGKPARAGIALGRLELGLGLERGLQARIRDEETTVDEQRTVALASAGLDIVSSRRARLALALGLGVASFARTTRAVQSPELRPTHASNPVSFAGALELRAALRLLSLGAFALEMELDAGALAVPAAPLLRYDGAHGTVSRALWLVQPHVRMGPLLRVAF